MSLSQGVIGLGGMWFLWPQLYYFVLLNNIYLWVYSELQKMFGTVFSVYKIH